jgi:hypothetical protein
MAASHRLRARAYEAISIPSCFVYPIAARDIYRSLNSPTNHQSQITNHKFPCCIMVGL